MWKLAGTGSRHGASPASRAGDVLRQPRAWACIVAAMSLAGPRARRAALRGVSCSAIAGLVQLPFKRLFRRPRPLGARLIGRGAPLTSSFPSGHTATDLSFVLGAAQELPALIVPLSMATLTSHWSLIRSRRHYPSDIIAGGAIAIAVTKTAWVLRPPSRAAPATGRDGAAQSSDGQRR